MSCKNRKGVGSALCVERGRDIGGGGQGSVGPEFSIKGIATVGSGCSGEAIIKHIGKQSICFDNYSNDESQKRQIGGLYLQHLTYSTQNPYLVALLDILVDNKLIEPMLTRQDFESGAIGTELNGECHALELSLGLERDNSKQNPNIHIEKTGYGFSFPILNLGNIYGSFALQGGEKIYLNNFLPNRVIKARNNVAGVLFIDSAFNFNWNLLRTNFQSVGLNYGKMVDDIVDDWVSSWPSGTSGGKTKLRLGLDSQRNPLRYEFSFGRENLSGEEITLKETIFTLEGQETLRKVANTGTILNSLYYSVFGSQKAPLGKEGENALSSEAPAIISNALKQGIPVSYEKYEEVGDIDSLEFGAVIHILFVNVGAGGKLESALTRRYKTEKGVIRPDAGGELLKLEEIVEPSIGDTAGEMKGILEDSLKSIKILADRYSILDLIKHEVNKWLVTPSVKFANAMVSGLAGGVNQVSASTELAISAFKTQFQKSTSRTVEMLVMPNDYIGRSTGRSAAQIIAAKTVGQSYMIGLQDTITNNSVDFPSNGFQLTLKYTDTDLIAAGLTEAEADTDKLSICLWDDANKAWVFIGGTFDKTTKSVTATITKAGIYTLVYGSAASNDVPSITTTSADALEFISPPVIEAKFSDEFGGINKNSIKLTLDGQIKINSSNIDSCNCYDTGSKTLRYTTDSNLGAGDHNYNIYVEDTTGQKSEITRTFKIKSADTFAKGDVDGDGDIDKADGELALDYVLGKKTLTPEQHSRADVAPVGAINGIVDILDAMVLLRYANGLISGF